MQGDAHPLATATLARTENLQGECLSTRAEIHLSATGGLSVQALDPIHELEEVIDTTLVGFALRIVFERGVPLATAADLVRHCIMLLGYELGTALVIWPIAKRTN